MSLAELVRRAAPGPSEGKASGAPGAGAAAAAASGAQPQHLYLRSVGENPRREPANLAESFPGVRSMKEA